MNAVRDLQTRWSSRTHPLMAAAVSVILACGTGIAAMTGLLPSSKATANAGTASALVDSQVAKAGAVADKPAPASADTPLSRAVRGHHVRPASVHSQTPAAAQVAPSTRAPTYAENTARPTIRMRVRWSPSTPCRARSRRAISVRSAARWSQRPCRHADRPGMRPHGGRLSSARSVADWRAIRSNMWVRKTTTYQVQVRINDGSTRTFNYEAAPGVAVGERVRVSGESLTPA